MNKKTVHIHIGEYHASRNPVIIKTLLGSCIGVCLFDRTTRIGGMNHILLPGRADLKHFDSSARFGINAMELLINKIMRLGGNRNKIVAKIFGGAHMLPAISMENGVGKKNVAFIIDFLRNESIPLVNRDVGGYTTRKLYFHTDTGNVYLKRIRTEKSKLLREEQFYRRMSEEVKKSGSIEWFS